MEKDVPHVLARLRRLWEHEHFERDISTQLYMLDGEPLCANLLKKTAIFHRQVFEVKGQMTMALTIGSLARDYENHRSVALNSLKLLYENFDQELNNVIPQLKAKARL